MKSFVADAAELANRLSLGRLRAAYMSGALTPRAALGEVMDRIAQSSSGTHPSERNVWISVLPREQVLARAERLMGVRPDCLPLYGIPFAIKDNIDLEGCMTTAACREYAYIPRSSAFVVGKLLEAGAIPVGKTNLDQFATGLVGTRSPYGICTNAFDERYIAGGSSSGSALAVARGLVSFALGTDTAGSGRVPAAFNNIVGVKPSCGLLSTRGIVPACRSLDCVSIFASTAADAAQVLQVAQGFDPADPYSRLPRVPAARTTRIGSKFFFGVPRSEQLQFFGDVQYAQLFGHAIERLQSMGGTCVAVDFSPFAAAARLLYEGPWVAERYAALEAFIRQKPQALLPVTLQILEAGAAASAVDVFNAQHRLAELRRQAERVWGQVDVMLTPTAGTIYTIEAVTKQPFELNSNLGYYTNFMNLLDLCAIALPGGWRADGLPFGITLFAPAASDTRLLSLAERWERTADPGMAATVEPRASLQSDTAPPAAPQPETIVIAVCGAHMRDLELNYQLLERGGRFVEQTRTAPLYRFYALAGGPPHRPGLLRTDAAGVQVDVELWALPAERFGSFVALIPSPLGIGKVLLEDSTAVSGFICEAHGIAGARDISAYGSWRNYLAADR